MNLFRKAYVFYADGFRSMTVGRYLWLIILVKLFIMFFILRLFFFRSELSRFSTQEQKSEHVLEQLVERAADDADQPF